MLPPPVCIPPVASFEIAPVTVINPGFEPVAHQRVVVREGRIDVITGVSAGPQQERFATPGLIDMHVHLPPWYFPGQRDLFLALFLLHGVTSIRDVGSVDGRVFTLAAAIDAGSVAGPRVFGCGPWLDGDPPEWPVARLVASASDAEAAVGALPARASCVKVLAGVSAGIREVLRAAAHRRGLPLVGHLPAQASFGEWRLDEIEHVCDPHCWQMGPIESALLVKTAREHAIAHTPTLVVYDRQETLYDGDPRATPAVAFLPRVWADVLWSPRYRLGFEPPPPSQRQTQRSAHRAMFAAIQETVRGLHQAGVPIYTGTDVMNPMVVPGDSLHREMALLVDSGLTRTETWQAATSAPGRALARDGLGTITPGAPADFLVFRKNPVDDLGALDSLEAVVAGGRYYDVEELRREIEAQLRHFSGEPFNWLSTTAAPALLDWWVADATPDN